MKIEFRTVTGREFELEVCETATVADVKQLLASEYKLSAENLKLIVGSVILADDQKVSQSAVPLGSCILVHQSNQRVVRNNPRKLSEKPKVQEDPDDFDARVNKLVEMGFSNKRECEEILRSVNYNAALAVDLLVSKGSQAAPAPPPPQPRSRSRDLSIGRQELSGIIRGLTPEDRAAVDRIVKAGFRIEDVTQFYFACDKDEALTLSLLREN